MILRAGLACTLSLGLLVAPAARASASAAEHEVDLRPREKADWNARNVFAWLTSPLLFSYWYREPVVRVETVPADADVDLFYVRSNFQHRFEQTKAPVRIRLLSRIESTSRDSLGVRVMAKGHSTSHEVYKVHDLPRDILVKLALLPNSLLAFDAAHLAGRTTFTLRTKGEPEVRVGRARGDARFTLALHATANVLESPPRVSTPNVKGVDLVQVGEDLLLRIDGSDADLELRSQQRRDPVRNEYLFTLDLQPKGFRPPTPGAVRQRVESRRVGPCDSAFEQSLYAALADEGGKLSLPEGSLVERFAREIVLRIGRADEGRLRLRSGESLRIGSPLELALALQSARDIEGYLGLIGAIARDDEDPPSFARALAAPDMAPGAFGRAFASAESVYVRCAGP